MGEFLSRREVAERLRSFDADRRAIVPPRADCRGEGWKANPHYRGCYCRLLEGQF